jgi:hypothetical protein
MRGKYFLLTKRQSQPVRITARDGFAGSYLPGPAGRDSHAPTHSRYFICARRDEHIQHAALSSLPLLPGH